VEAAPLEEERLCELRAQLGVAHVGLRLALLGRVAPRVKQRLRERLAQHVRPHLLVERGAAEHAGADELGGAQRGAAARRHLVLGRLREVAALPRVAAQRVPPVGRRSRLRLHVRLLVERLVEARRLHLRRRALDAPQVQTARRRRLDARRRRRARHRRLLLVALVHGEHE